MPALTGGIWYANYLPKMGLSDQGGDLSVLALVRLSGPWPIKAGQNEARQASQRQVHQFQDATYLRLTLDIP